MGWIELIKCKYNIAVYINVNRCMRWHIFSSSHLFYTASFDKLKQYYYSYNTKTPRASLLTVKKTNTPFSIFKYLLLMMMGRANPSFPLQKKSSLSLEMIVLHSEFMQNFVGLQICGTKFTGPFPQCWVQAPYRARVKLRLGPIHDTIHSMQ